jgi:hypothetical protein
MSTNIIKKSRVNEVDALQKLADGLTQHASTAPAVVLAGVTLKPGDVVAKLQTRIAQAKAVSSAAANLRARSTLFRAGRQALRCDARRVSARAAAGRGEGQQHVGRRRRRRAGLRASWLNGSSSIPGRSSHSLAPTRSTVGSAA